MYFSRISSQVRQSGVASLALGAALVAYFAWPMRVPPSIYVDTASTLLNAICLAAGGRDEYGEAWPLILRSIGDYKAPLLTYVTTLLTSLVGPSLLLLRLTTLVAGAAALGALAAGGAHTLWTPKKPSFTLLAWLCAAFLLSPWFLVVQRFAVEPALDACVMTLVVTTTALLITRGGLLWAVASGAASALGLYTYHSLKVVFVCHVPLLLLATAWQRMHHTSVTVRWRDVAASLVTAAALGAPMIGDVLWGSGHSLTRLSQIDGAVDTSWLQRYLQSFSLEFWFWRGDNNVRHHHGFMGMLNLGLLPLVVGGIAGLSWRVLRRKASALELYVLVTLLVCFVPASLTTDSLPHALRTHIAVVPLFVICIWAHGAIRAARPQLARTCAAMCMCVGSVQAVVGLHHFYTVYPQAPHDELTFELPLRLPDKLPGAQDHSAQSVGHRLAVTLQTGEPLYCEPGAL